MWKKDELATPSPNPEPQREPAPRVETATPRQSFANTDKATIGRSIAIRGDVTGDEDLVIQGRVEGSVDLQQHSVTVGPEGEVRASVVGRIVTVEGLVEGNIQGDEQVILRSSARVEGDIVAPRVVLEDGARFRGGIDMGGEVASRNRANGIAAPERKSPERPSKTAPIVSNVPVEAPASAAKTGSTAEPAEARN
jgi:cytoskeletal protein CcmA (bactofilin family)